MKAPAGLKKNHQNRGGHKGGMAATFHDSEIPGTPNETGGGAPAVHQPTLRNHLNRGSGATHGMAATHHQSEKPDPTALPVTGAGMEE